VCYVHYVFLSYIEPESNTDVDVPLTTLYVGHLPFNMTESELMSLFSGCIQARIISDPFTGQSKGYTYL